MSDLWQPDLASPSLEEKMETADLPEGDRDEVRRFAEFLRRKKEFRENGKCVEPPPPEMKAWLLGEDNHA